MAMQMEMKPKLNARQREGERERKKEVESNSMEIVIAIENCMQKKLCQNEMYPTKDSATTCTKKPKNATQLHTHMHARIQGITLFYAIKFICLMREKKERMANSQIEKLEV